MLRQVDVLGVVEVCVRRVEDGVDHPGLQVQEHSTRDVVLIIGLGDIVYEEREKTCRHSRVTSIVASSLKSLKYATITPSSGEKLFCVCVIKKGGQDRFTDATDSKQNYW